MTTQHTHHEHDDVDTPVMESSSTSASTADAIVSSTTQPVEAHQEVEHPFPEPVLSAPDQEDAPPTPALAAPAEPTPEQFPSSRETTEPVATADEPVQAASAVTVESESIHSSQLTEENTEVPSPEVQNVSEAENNRAPALAAVEEEEAVSPSRGEQEPEQQATVIPEVPEITVSQREDVPPPPPAPTDALEAAKVEEVRPFTDFIEEFRQAEEARLHATLHEAEAAPFSLSHSTEPFSPASEQTQLASPSTSGEEHMAINSVAPSLSEQESAKDVAPLAAPVTSAAQTQTAEGNNETAPATTEDTTATETAPVEPPRPTPPVRAVSPLLRPATRLRVPRHGVPRQPREEPPVEAAKPAPVEKPAEPVAEQPAAAESTQRPTRRYRFDRPAANSKAAAAATTAQTRTEEPRETQTATTTTAHTEPAQPVSEPVLPTAATTASTTSTANGGEVAGQKQLAQALVQETAPAEAAIATPPAPAAPEHGRRRHTQQAQKEQVVTSPAPPVLEAAPPTITPPVAEETVAPEDLPPLEYAELQKATSRRRRRHRSTTTPPATAAPTTSAALNTPIAPVIPPSPLSAPVIPPVAPAQPAAPAPAAAVTPQRPANGNSTAPYSIVSGYTVNQMNMGSEIGGPFMGPDPSPARGSVFTRDARITPSRGEAQRTTGPSSYPGRSGDNGFSAASMTQFANIVSQAIQTQTDRMIAEMRRANQAPTSVSVTLPPFPSTERVGVFVDVANLLYSARTLRMAVDFAKLLDFLRGNRRLVRAHAYCPTSPQAGDEQMFLQAVKGLGYRITTKNYKTFSSGAKKADLDLDLCMDVVRLVDGRAVDCIVLVSGDSDFMPMLDYCSDHGVRVEVAAFDEAMSATLRQSCDLFINLSMLDDIKA